MIVKNNKKSEFIIIAALLLAAVLAAAVLYFKGGDPKGNVAVVYYNSEPVAEFKLSEYTESVIVPMSSLSVNLPVSFELKDGQIRFINVTCPDHICENYGFIRLTTQTAVCMPNRTSVMIREQ